MAGEGIGRAGGVLSAALGGTCMLTSLLALVLVSEAASLQDSFNEAEKLRPEFDSWMREAESKQEWTQLDASKSEAAFRGVLSARSVCILYYRDRFSKSKESIDNVITAIFGFCQNYEASLERAISLSFRSVMSLEQRSKAASDLIVRSKSKERESLVAYFVKLRMNPGENR
ncbi:conotoxin [Novosphingobium sp. MW5]|nr:conotoxin [Novosphingobium sp. MW5]